MPEQLGNILKHFSPDMVRTVNACRQLDIWQKIVDERIGKNAEAIKIKDRVLHVSTSTPTWAQELNFLKNEIVMKFNNQAGAEVIIDIRFKPNGGV